MEIARTAETATQSPFSDQQTKLLTSLIDLRKRHLMTSRTKLAENYYGKLQVGIIDTELAFLKKVVPEAQNGNVEGANHFLSQTILEYIPHIPKTYPVFSDIYEKYRFRNKFVDQLSTAIDINSLLETAHDTRADLYRKVIREKRDQIALAQWDVDDPTNLIKVAQY